MTNATAAGGAGAARSRHLPLDGVRFIPMFLIFLSHVALTVPFASLSFTKSYFKYFGGVGQIGVSFFFVLSGFVLAWTARRKDTVLAFLRRRIVRIYPIHVVTLLLALAVFGTAMTTLDSSLANLALIQSWSSEPRWFNSLNAPSWSLSPLLFFYVAFPLLHRLLHRLRPQFLWWCAGAMVALVIALPAVVRALVPADPAAPPFFRATSMKAFWLVEIFPPSRLPEFALGMVLAYLVKSGRWIRIPLPAALLLAPIGYVVSLNVPKEYQMSAAMIIPWAVIVPAIAASDSKFGETLLGNRMMVWLSKQGLAFMLVQYPVMIFFDKQFGITETYTVTEGMGLAALDLVTSIALAWILTTCIDWLIARLPSSPRPQPVETPAERTGDREALTDRTTA
ncbi:acyltransferase family protein [Kitasatospora sp. NPDC101183]|uniref:acyltransferase family protein n=1 Tax=Kitasatospora sp. NPDC101183 TaxID=3364100 RepID=UPI00380A690C